jgi:hypothetical protein
MNICFVTECVLNPDGEWGNIQIIRSNLSISGRFCGGNALGKLVWRHNLFNRKRHTEHRLDRELIEEAYLS